MQRRVIYVHNTRLATQADKNPAVSGRAKLTHELISAYDLLKYLIILEPKMCKTEALSNYHSLSYISHFVNPKCNNVLNVVKSDPDKGYKMDNIHILVAATHGITSDCPIWPGIERYLQAISGSTLSACMYMCEHKNDIGTPLLLNWGGGWSHAGRDRASEHCYVNDIAMGIKMLRMRFRRILYIDLDVHHGDAVQSAFNITPQVITLSFHQFEDGFFPGTGAVDDCGSDPAKGYAINFPYRRGITGDTFRKYFKRILRSVVRAYHPEVFVAQTGAGALAGDAGHTALVASDLMDCIHFLTRVKIPTLLLGGCGRNLGNAARYWTQLTAQACGVALDNSIPLIDRAFLNSDVRYELNVNLPSHIKDENTEEELERNAQIIEANIANYVRIV